jgi:hypothetical protein
VVVLGVIGGGFGGDRWWFWGFNPQNWAVYKKKQPHIDCVVV